MFMCDCPIDGCKGLEKVDEHGNQFCRLKRDLAMVDYQRAPGHVQWNPEGTTPPPDPVTESLRADLLQRQRVGWTKYGIGLGRADFTMLDWLHHLEEELMDALQYTRRLRMTLKGELKVVGPVENVIIKDELPAQEINRLTQEIAIRQSRILRLVGGDPTKGVHVPTQPVVYSHEACIFAYCPARKICEAEKTCVHQRGERNLAAEQSPK